MWSIINKKYVYGFTMLSEPHNSYFTALPTTPVSVQYTTTTFPGAAHAPGSVHPPTLVPPSVKTLATGQGSSSTQNIVNLTSQASITAQPAHQQIIHPKGAHGVTFVPPSCIRPVSYVNIGRLLILN